jgi:hypothetical protein
MTATAKKLAAATPQDPVLEAFLRAPIDPNPRPEHEREALEDPSTMQFVDGSAVTRELAERGRAERRAARRAR